MMRQLMIGFVAGSIAIPAVAQPDPAPAIVATRVERYLAPLIAAGHLSGTLLLARGDTILYQGAFGWIDRPGGRPMTPSTPGAVASITKPITSIVASRLIEMGRLADSDRVSRWIPDFPGGERITIEMLRGHRAGIPHRVTSAAEEYQHRTSVEMVRLIGPAPRLFEPNARRSYSSMGYVVLARILELAGGKPYPDLVDELVLRPAGARASFDASRAGSIETVATPILLGSDGPTTRRPRDLSFLIGAGSLYSTPADLFRILQALERGDLGAAARTRLIQDTTLWTGLTDYRRAYLQHRVADRTTMVLVANLLTGAGDLILRDLPRIALGEDLPPPTMPTYSARPMSPAVQARVGGDYGFQPGLWTPLQFVGPTMALAGDYLLVPTSDTTFFSMADYADVFVVPAGSGSVSGLRWGSAGGPVFPRRTQE